jgi:hypothetical protein
MATEPALRTTQQRWADRLAERLTGTAGELAARTSRQEVTAATPEQVDAVALLTALGRQLPDFCRRAILGQLGTDDWEQMSAVLTHAARACREQIVIDIPATDDQGSDSPPTDQAQRPERES